MLLLCWIRHLDVNKNWQVDALFTSLVSGSGLSPLLPGRFTLWKELLFPLNSRLMLPISDPGTFVPDRNEVVFPGIVIVERICNASTNFERKLIFYSCVTTCKTATTVRLLCANHDIIFVKITSTVTNEILNICMSLFNFLNIITADMIF